MIALQETDRIVLKRMAEDFIKAPAYSINNSFTSDNFDTIQLAISNYSNLNATRIFAKMEISNMLQTETNFTQELHMIHHVLNVLDRKAMKFAQNNTANIHQQYCFAFSYMANQLFKLSKHIKSIL